MAKPAVETVPSRVPERPMDSLRAQLGYGRRFKLRRGHVIALAVVAVAAWALLSFGRTITQLNAATDRESQLTDETTSLSAQLDASRREMELVQSEAFQQIQARAYGMGAPGEIVFALEPGAPSPVPVVPLGGLATKASAQTPLDTWLRLLFGD
jgi:cell division protein FtsB